MSEHQPEPDAAAEIEVDADSPAEPLRTGHTGVDAVLGSLDGLEDLPVDDHVAVFERAHDGLRQALDAHPEE